MNRIYRLVWNTTLQLWVAVAETTKARGKASGGRSATVGAPAFGYAQIGCQLSSLFKPVAIAMPVLLAMLSGQSAYAANAADATVSAGQGAVSTVGNTTTITQTSQRLAIDWIQLNTKANEALVFNQPNSQAIALNRITGSSPSVLLGSLTANGQVFILNPNGVLFGAGSQVNVGGLVASTLSMSNADFMAGRTTFTQNTDNNNSVINQGTLTATPGGYIALLAPEVRNEGVIVAQLGTALLAAGKQVTLTLDGSSLIGYNIDVGAVQAVADNRQLIQADGGQVILAARAANELTSAAVNNTGVIEARTVADNAGRILLLADKDNGTVNLSGTLDASAAQTGNGGFIETSAAHVLVADGTVVTTLANNGKTGTWLIDPTDFTISSGSAGQTNSGMGATTLATNLASSNITLATDNSSGTDSGDINVNAAVSWAANTTLTLNAYHDINVNAAITASGSSAGLVMNYGNYATNGTATGGTDYKVNAPITLSGSSASLAINGNSYTLLHSMNDISTANTTGHYALAQDLDASANGSYSAAVLDTLNGTLAGLGHTVSNLIINTSADDIGFIGHVASTGVLRDIHLSNANVSARMNAGALVGHNYGTIEHSDASGAVSGDANLGGLVGYNDSTASISNSSATVAVNGSNDVGGLVGLNAGIIGNSYATGAATGSGDQVGGLNGGNIGTISNSYATGSANGRHHVGGLVGQNDGSISDSYATGAVNASGINAGGLVGNNDAGPISNSYATGAVSGAGNVGGLVGVNNGSLSNSYWDSDSTGQANAVGWGAGSQSNISAVTSSTRYNHSSYTNLGTWAETVSGSGVFVATDGSGQVWVMIEGSTRPFLYSEYSSSIHNAHQLQLMALNLGARYTLANDIDASATTGSNSSDMWGTAGFSPVGSSTAQFTGSLNGQSHTVDALSINRSSNDVGLFGVALNASISNLNLTNLAITGGNEVGGLVGLNQYGTISASSATGAVSGTNKVGGLVGYNQGTVTNSSAASTVSGGNKVGGLVGENDYIINASSASGDVTGSGNGVGGLVGANYYSIDSSTASGHVIGSGTQVGGLAGYNDTGAGISNSSATGTVNSSGDVVGGLVGYNDGSISTSSASGSVTSTADNVGGLVGYNDESGTISNSNATGNVSGNNSVGGLVGNNDNAISASTASGSVSGQNMVGGLVGANYYTIDTSTASGAVSGSDTLGGLAGYNQAYASITNSSATGAVTGAGSSRVGGLVGENAGTIASSNASGNVTAAGTQVGGLVGVTDVGGSVTSSHATGAVSGQDFVGGLVGDNYGTVSNSYATGAVTGIMAVGGLVGDNDSGASISGSYATGNVSGDNSVGGLAGANDTVASISNSYATGAVTGGTTPGNYDAVGGLVGYNAGTINIGSASGTVSSSSDQAGGLVGFNDTSGSVSNSSATGSVSGSAMVGGLVGENAGTIAHGTASNTVTGTGDGVGGLVGVSDTGSAITHSNASGTVSGQSNVGGLVGDNYGTVSNSSYTGATLTGGYAVGGLVGHNESGASISNSDATGAVIGSSNVGGLVGSNDTGASISSSDATGAVTGGTTPGNYDAVGGLVGYNAGTIDIGSASGNVSSSSDQVGGLVGFNGSSGSVTNSSAAGSVSGGVVVGGLVGENAGTIANGTASGNVTGTGTQVGGLVGVNDTGSSLTASYATGMVSGQFYVGGLVGDNYGDISNSYASGDVAGVASIGGLVGYNDPGASISNTYATGTVNASGTEVGGLVGTNEDASISNSYSSGAVSGAGALGGLVGASYGAATTLNSFWNTDTSGQATSDGGTGKTSAQMQQAATFTAAGWDIASAGGSNSVWRIYEGTTSPLLRSFLGSDPASVTTQTSKTSAADVATAAAAGNHIDGPIMQMESSSLIESEGCGISLAAGVSCD